MTSYEQQELKRGHETAQSVVPDGQKGKTLLIKAKGEDNRREGGEFVVEIKWLIISPR